MTARKLDGISIQPWHPFTREAVQPVEADAPMLMQVEIFPSSFEIQAGHALRVTIAPYDVPHALSPLEGILGSLGGIVEVLTDPQHPSSIVLPVESEER